MATIASFAAKAAEHAAEAAQSSTKESAMAAAGACDFASQAANDSPEFRDALQKDFKLLCRLASEGNWTDETPVPRSVLE